MNGSIIFAKKIMFTLDFFTFSITSGIPFDEDYWEEYEEECPTLETTTPQVTTTDPDTTTELTTDNASTAIVTTTPGGTTTTEEPISDKCVEHGTHNTGIDHSWQEGSYWMYQVKKFFFDFGKIKIIKIL